LKVNRVYLQFQLHAFRLPIVAGVAAVAQPAADLADQHREPPAVAAVAVALHQALQACIAACDMHKFCAFSIGLNAADDHRVLFLTLLQSANY
jgi:hypothetical protein